MRPGHTEEHVCYIAVDHFECLHFPCAEMTGVCHLVDVGDSQGLVQAGRVCCPLSVSPRTGLAHKSLSSRELKVLKQVECGPSCQDIACVQEFETKVSKTVRLCLQHNIQPGLVRWLSSLRLLLPSQKTNPGPCKVGGKLVALDLLKE